MMYFSAIMDILRISLFHTSNKLIWPSTSYNKKLELFISKHASFSLTWPYLKIMLYNKDDTSTNIIKNEISSERDVQELMIFLNKSQKRIDIIFISSSQMIPP